MESFPSDKRAPFPMALSVVTLLKLSVLPSTDIYAAPITATQVLNRTENTRNGENPIKLIGDVGSQLDSDLLGGVGSKIAEMTVGKTTEKIRRIIGNSEHVKIEPYSNVLELIQEIKTEGDSGREANDAEVVIEAKILRYFRVVGGEPNAKVINTVRHADIGQGFTEEEVELIRNFLHQQKGMIKQNLLHPDLRKSFEGVMDNPDYKINRVQNSMDYLYDTIENQGRALSRLSRDINHYISVVQSASNRFGKNYKLTWNSKSENLSLVYIMPETVVAALQEYKEKKHKQNTEMEESVLPKPISFDKRETAWTALSGNPKVRYTAWTALNSKPRMVSEDPIDLGKDVFIAKSADLYQKVSKIQSRTNMKPTPATREIAYNPQKEKEEVLEVPKIQLTYKKPIVPLQAKKAPQRREIPIKIYDIKEAYQLVNLAQKTKTALIDEDAIYKEMPCSVFCSDEDTRTGINKRYAQPEVQKLVADLQAMVEIQKQDVIKGALITQEFKKIVLSKMKELSSDGGDQLEKYFGPKNGKRIRLFQNVHTTISTMDEVIRNVKFITQESHVAKDGQVGPRS